MDGEKVALAKLTLNYSLACSTSIIVRCAMRCLRRSVYWPNGWLVKALTSSLFSQTGSRRFAFDCFLIVYTWWLLRFCVRFPSMSVMLIPLFSVESGCYSNINSRVDLLISVLYKIPVYLFFYFTYRLI